MTKAFYLSIWNYFSIFVNFIFHKNQNETILKKFLRIILCIIIIIAAVQLLWNIGILFHKMREPSVGSIQEINENTHSIKIERVPDSPYLWLKYFTLSPDGKRYGYVSYNYSSLRNQLYLPMDWAIIIDGEVVYQCKMPIAHLLVGRMTVPTPYLSFSFDSRHYAFKVNDQAFIDGKPIQLPGCDKVLDIMFLPHDKILFRIIKGDQEFLRLDECEFSLPKSKYPDGFRPRFIAVNETSDSVVYFCDYFNDHENNSFYFNGNIASNIDKKTWTNLFGEKNTRIYCFTERIRQPYLSPPSDNKTRQLEYGFFPFEILEKKNSLYKKDDNSFQYETISNSIFDSYQSIFEYKQNIWDKLHEQQKFKIVIGDKQSSWFFIPRYNGNSFAKGNQNDNQATLFASRYGCLYRIDIQKMQ